ncbi:hypothetical protein K491DRAFT_689959 [Lophiostoma macrostomum CBS 122681]|uniref:Uncharacterized protein n=1 Tax=Lophiostoma macrostomum CBS 122681 TaxID=1314788 RepID=A0A6A6THF9_9PLEO|nr:hypothetical protein K491DRAFT_689959 [Lophiostoma macrostomum CBS 122681]
MYMYPNLVFQIDISIMHFEIPRWRTLVSFIWSTRVMLSGVPIVEGVLDVLICLEYLDRDVRSH